MRFFGTGLHFDRSCAKCGNGPPRVAAGKARKTLTTALHTGRAASRRAAPASSAAHEAAEHALQTVIASLEDSKAENRVSIDIRGKSALGDYMVVASGRSHRHVGAIADHLVRALKNGGQRAPRVEGLPHCDWVLIDAGDVIVHIFRPEIREFYALEKMWQVPDAQEVH